MKNIESIVADIVKDIFTNGSGEEADRLVLELPDRRYGGGWCRAAVKDVIRKHFYEDNERKADFLKEPLVREAMEIFKKGEPK